MKCLRAEKTKKGVQNNGITLNENEMKMKTKVLEKVLGNVQNVFGAPLLLLRVYDGD